MRAPPRCHGGSRASPEGGCMVVLGADGYFHVGPKGRRKDVGLGEAGWGRRAAACGWPAALSGGCPRESRRAGRRAPGR
eukprot:4900713-Pyramimonas_sp.AAC.1